MGSVSHCAFTALARSSGLRTLKVIGSFRSTTHKPIIAESSKSGDEPKRILILSLLSTLSTLSVISKLWTLASFCSS